MTLKFIQIDEMLKQPCRDELTELLSYAARCIEAGQLESACWRIADASLLLRRRIKSRGIENVHGLHEPTGRNALLGG